MQHDWDCLHLDWSWGFVAKFAQVLEHFGMEVEFLL